jgi:catechol 2,3-dioxygenase-like lactoylglutathione lyase family enzyme
MPGSPTHPRLGHLLETSVYVADLDRAQGFYQRVFGFELFLRDHRMSALSVPGAGVLLLFLRGGSVEPTPTGGGGDIPSHDGGGSVHLCFAMPMGELAAWEAHLDRLGIPVESRITWPRGGTSLYFRDPDDSLVELATPGLWPSW